MTLTTDFTEQVTDTMALVEFTNDAILVIAKEASELRGQRFQLLLACPTFGCLFAFALWRLLVRFLWRVTYHLLAGD
jgi:hypothetical protein